MKKIQKTMVAAFCGFAGFYIFEFFYNTLIFLFASKNNNIFPALIYGGITAAIYNAHNKKK